MSDEEKMIAELEQFVQRAAKAQAEIEALNKYWLQLARAAIEKAKGVEDS